MAQVKTGFNLSVTFLKEGDQFVAYSPALDLSTCGGTLEEARRRFGEAALLFIQELHQKGVTKKVLSELGWQEKNSSFIPPLVVGQENCAIPLRV